MIQVIDNINAVTGWTASALASIHGLSGMPTFSAGNNSTSLIVKFSGINTYVEKLYDDIDISEYDEIILWISSRNKGKKQYRTYEDYEYKISFSDTDEFYLPVYSDFYYIRIKADFDTVSKLKITALTEDEDYLILSYFLVNKTILPLDIFQGAKEQIEYYRDNFFSLKQVGTIDASIGDTSIEFSAPVSYLDRYAVIKITDGVNTEYHGIESRDKNKYFFTQAYDGSKILYTFEDAVVYLYYPVEFGTSSKDIVFPAITIWGFTPERVLISSDLDNIVDTVKSDNTYYERQVGQYLEWLVLIDCTAKEEYEVLGELSNIVRKVMGQKVVWVNGRKCYIDYGSAPTIQNPNDSYDIIPQIQYSGIITVREELYEDVSLPATVTINVEVTPTEQGEI